MIRPLYTLEVWHSTHTPIRPREDFGYKNNVVNCKSLNTSTIHPTVLAIRLFLPILVGSAFYASWQRRQNILETASTTRSSKFFSASDKASINRRKIPTRALVFLFQNRICLLMPGIYCAATKGQCTHIRIPSMSVHNVHCTHIRQHPHTFIAYVYIQGAQMCACVCIYMNIIVPQRVCSICFCWLYEWRGDPTPTLPTPPSSSKCLGCHTFSCSGLSGHFIKPSQTLGAKGRQEVQLEALSAVGKITIGHASCEGWLERNRS